MAALLSSARRRKRARSCHFCDAKTSQDCNCGGWTRRDANGNLIGYLPEMSDITLNPTPIQPDQSYYSRRPFSSNSPHQSTRKSPQVDVISDSPFCRTCSNNQTLQLNLVANYLPGDTDEFDNSSIPSSSATKMEDLLKDLPRYKRSLDSRYPILCSDCSPRVAQIIKAKNYRLKAQSFNESIKKFSHLTSSTSPLRSNFQPKESIRLQLGGKRFGWWWIQELIWKLGASIWGLSHLLGILLSVYCTILFCKSAHLAQTYSDSKNSNCGERLHPSEHAYLLLDWYHCLDIIWSLGFDPSWIRIRKFKIQGIEVKRRGRKRFLGFNLISSVLRLIVRDYLFGPMGLLNSLVVRLHPSYHLSLFGAITITSILMFVGSLWVITIESKIGLRKTTLKRAEVTGTDQVYANLFRSTHPNQHEMLSDLTLSDSYNLVGPQHSNAIPEMQASIDKEKDEEMDWEPSIEHNSHQVIELPPQKFLPPPRLRKKEVIGIEDLFQEKIQLKDDQLNEKSSTRNYEPGDAGRDGAKQANWIVDLCLRWGHKLVKWIE